MKEEEKRVFIELPAFTGRNVPITELLRLLGKMHNLSYWITKRYFKIWLCNEKR